MAGGKGERFWPRSTISTPKQLQKIYSNKTLLQETFDRAKLITSNDRIFIGCNNDLKKAIQKTHKIENSRFIIEPEAKNTAPIIALAALQLEEKFPGAVQVILSADHFIQPLQKFKESIQNAIEVADQNYLVTCGVVPSRPDSGYGYIQPLEKSKIEPVGFEIKQFHEKPDFKKAVNYVKQGFFWNSGIFIWKGSVILEEFKAHASFILQPIESSYKNGSKLKTAFSKIQSLPIDIAIMEKSNRRAVIPATFEWDDVGSWLAIDRIRQEAKDNDGNIFVGNDTTNVTLSASNNIVVSNSKKLIALLGVKDLIFVETDSSIFIASKAEVDNIKSLLAKLKQKPALQRFLK
ncbi:MAG: mannose-1-phosphate guanylyltransferase [Leptonema sp. (in: Bacteria)]|nr:mannose-1-phosphate guanylyltransferase [Leptonema sp. (in: bacteria)]